MATVQVPRQHSTLRPSHYHRHVLVFCFHCGMPQRLDYLVSYLGDTFAEARKACSSLDVALGSFFVPDELLLCPWRDFGRLANPGKIHCFSHSPVFYIWRWWLSVVHFGHLQMALEWPSQRLYLNPIELLWQDLKQAAHAQKPTNLSGLKQLCEWARISPEMWKTSNYRKRWMQLFLLKVGQPVTV